MDDVITLISKTLTTYDTYGNEVMTTTTRTVMCRVYDTTRNEFYAAAQAGLKPDITVRLSDHADYQGEKSAMFHGDEFDVIRTYRGNDSFGGQHYSGGLELNNIELILQKKVSNG